MNKYNNYKLVEVSLNDLNINEYYLFDNLVNEYSEEYEKTGYYPPIVISHNNKLIDGNHRSNALKKSGLNKIKAFKGI